MIQKAITYTVITILLLVVLQWFMFAGLRHNKQGIYDKYNTLFLNTNSYNTLILGSSRAEMHYDVNLYDSLTGSKTYNAGISGASIRMAYIVLQSYLVKSKMPNTIVLDCDFHRTNATTDSIYNFSRFFPYLSNRKLYHYLHDIDNRFFQFKYNPCYSLAYLGINSLNPALHGWFNKTGMYDSNYKNGFFKNTTLDNYNHVGISEKSRRSYISSEVILYLDSIIFICKQNKCKLILSLSPAYKASKKELLNTSEIVNQFKTIALKNNISCFDFSNDTSIINHKLYFEDNYHMMYLGAKLFTHKLTDSIILKQRTINLIP